MGKETYPFMVGGGDLASYLLLGNVTRDVC